MSRSPKRGSKPERTEKKATKIENETAYQKRTTASWRRGGMPSLTGAKRLTVTGLLRNAAAPK